MRGALRRIPGDNERCLPDEAPQRFVERCRHRRYSDRPADGERDRRAGCKGPPGGFRERRGGNWRRAREPAGARLAATASKPVTPTDRAPVASAIPRTAASPMRMPVKLPGPIVAPTMSSAAADNPDLRITASTIGSSLSVWPRAFAHRSAASTVSPAASTTEQPDPAESSASTIGSPDVAVTPWPLSIAARSGLRISTPLAGALTTLFYRGFTKPA